MMIETLMQSPAGWTGARGPEAARVVYTRATLARNLADLPFPIRSSDEEKRSAEERILAAIESAGLLEHGQYLTMSDLGNQEAQFLAERGLISTAIIDADGPRGVYIHNDQCMSIMVNETEHIRLAALGSGLQLQELWDRLNGVDDALTPSLDFAFHERFGYLTSALDSVGTGLHVAAVLHLPGLTAMNQVLEIEKSARDTGHTLSGVFGKIGSDPACLFRVANASTLGRSEEELVYHTRNFVTEVLQRETAACETMFAEGLRGIEDRVGRALGVARGARLLDLEEALGVLSSLRIGVVHRLLDDVSLKTINEMLLAAQPGHIQMKLGRDCDALTLSFERADLFRGQFN
jgi:protein arginine kinase